MPIRDKGKAPGDSHSSPLGLRFMAPLLIGTTLNPINSTLIAVALVPISQSLDVPATQTAWLISSFYIAAAIVQPLVGAMADRRPPRSVFIAGMLVVALAGAVGALGNSIQVLVAARVLLAIGTATAYPSALAIIRRRTDGLPETIVARSLGMLAISGQVMAAAGPPLGGLLVGTWGWKVTFLVNVPLAMVALVLTLRGLPLDGAKDPAPALRGRELLQRLDLIGLTMFGLVMAFLFTLAVRSSKDVWIEIPLLGLVVVAFLWWERRHPYPAIDVRVLGAHPALVLTFARFALSSYVLYVMFLALPQWLQDGRNLTTEGAGLIMVPMCILAPPISLLATRKLRYRLPLLINHSGMLLVASLLLLVNSETPIWVLLGISSLFAAPVALINVANQAAVYIQAPASHLGSATGVLRSVMFLGAVASAGIFGRAFAEGATDHGMHVIVLGMAVSSVVLLLTDAVSWLSGRLITTELPAPFSETSVPTDDETERTTSEPPRPLNPR